MKKILVLVVLTIGLSSVNAQIKPVKANVEGLTDAKLIDLTLISISRTFLTKEKIKNANLGSSFGYKDWVINVAKDPRINKLPNITTIADESHNSIHREIYSS
jgi:hypothetical protein